jgi:hypothetical protein
MIKSGTPTWKEPYEKAIKEHNKEKLGELILQAETAIYQRFQELQNSPNHNVERSQIATATEQLLSLKVNRLGWPPVG